MNKKILILSLGLLLLLSFLAPVMATSKNKSPATATPTTNIPVMTTIDLTYTKGGIEKFAITMGGAITINLNDGEGDVFGTYVDICSGTYNPRSNKGVYIFEEVWTFAEGTFVGTAHIKTEGTLFMGSYTRMTCHIVLHGTGVYEGQILNLRSDQAGGYPVYTGYVLKVDSPTLP